MGPKAKAAAKPAAKAEKKAPAEEKKDAAATHAAGHNSHDIQGSADFEAGVMFQK